MKLIDSSMLDLVSGSGSGNDTSGRSNNRGGSSRGSAPNTCANQVGTNIIIGAIFGIAGGPPGVIGGAAAAGLTTAVGCAGDKGSKGGDSDSNSVSGQCHW